MNTRQLAYWVTTALLSFGLISGGAAQLARFPANVEGMVHLGYPVYFMVILGVWKVLGGIALLAPRFALLKEWAYAGTVFEMTGASISHAACGDDVMHIVVPLVFTTLAVASWQLRPASRKLQPNLAITGT